MKCLKTPPRKVEFIGVSDHYCRSLKNLNQKHPWLTRLKKYGYDNEFKNL